MLAAPSELVDELEPEPVCVEDPDKVLPDTLESGIDGLEPEPEPEPVWVEDPDRVLPAAELVEPEPV